DALPIYPYSVSTLLIIKYYIKYPTLCVKTTPYVDVEPSAVNRLCLSMRDVRDYHPVEDYHPVATRGLGRFSFRPKSPQKGGGHLKHDFRLTERLLPDSAMTYRGRSDGLMVESDRKKMITFKCTCHLRDLERYCVYTSGGFFSPSFSPRQ